MVGLFEERVRVSHTAQIRIEEKLAQLAQQNIRDRSAALSVAVLHNAIAASGISFTGKQHAAIHALGEGAAITMLTGVAGAGKTTLLQPLVTAWQADTRYDPAGREVIGTALAWRQADALQDAGMRRTYALTTLLRMAGRGEFQPTRNTVLVIDEVSQIGPHQLLALLELQARTGMTIKMLGDPEQCQAIEAGDAIEVLNRVLPPEAMPELLTTIRQTTRRGREIAGLFREGEAAKALAMKREDGHAVLTGGDYDQVIARIVDLYITRRDLLLGSGSKDGITVSAPTDEDVAAISDAIRSRLRQRGELGTDEMIYQAIDQQAVTYDLPIAAGDRLRLFRKTWGETNGSGREIGSNGDIVEVLGRNAEGLYLRTKRGDAFVQWRRLKDATTGRLFLGRGHALTTHAAQGVTSDEHIDALPRGTAGVTAFTSYVAESRSRGITWTVISEGAMHEAERHRQAIGDITPITRERLWERAAEDMSRKPYKALGIDLLAAARSDRERAIGAFIECHVSMERAQIEDPDAGRKAFAKLRAAAVNANLGRHLQALNQAMEENAAITADIRRATEAREHLQALRAEAAAAKQRIEEAADPAPRPRGPSPR